MYLAFARTHAQIIAKRVPMPTWWRAKQTEPIRALHAQSMAAADSEPWANRSSHCCESRQTTVSQNLPLNKPTALLMKTRVMRTMKDTEKNVCMSLWFFFSFRWTLSAWSFVPGCILVFNNVSNKENINNINCSINVVLVLYSVCF